MSTSGHWFIVWVPSGCCERNEKSQNTAGAIRGDAGGEKIEADTCNHGEEKVEKVKVEEKVVGKSTNFVVTQISDESAVLGPITNAIPKKVVQIDDTSNLQDADDDNQTETTVHSKPFLEWEPLEDITKNVILSKNIKSLHIIQSQDKTQTQISFCVPFESVESLLLDLQNLGIGRTENTSISVIPASLHHSPDQGETLTDEAAEEARLDKFYSTIKSRLLVSEVIARIKSGSEFSFDFLLLLILAGMIAFMGLLENSSVVLVASMLVSPLMGPILAGIFGGTIQDTQLTWSGIRHEAYALFICIFIGFFFGLLICPWAEAYGVSQWPTQEMISRGELRALWVGVLIAVPSGAGVALSVLGGNAGSLVGVAISASLLPPAVNAGLFWSLSLVLAITGPDSYALFYGFGEQLNTATNKTISLYEPRYSHSLEIESFFLGLTSLALTLINILCIIITGVLILKLKEVTPEKIPQKFGHFWKEDIKTHRNYNQKIRKEDDHELKNASVRSKEAEDNLEGSFLHSMFERAAQDSDLINIRQWVAMPNAAMPRESDHKTPRIFQHSYSGDYQPLMSPTNQSTDGAPWTCHPSSGHHRLRRNTGQTPRDNYQTNSVNMQTFMDVPSFLQQELHRSKEMRRRLSLVS